MRRTDIGKEIPGGFREAREEAGVRTEESGMLCILVLLNKKRIKSPAVEEAKNEIHCHGI